MPVPLSRGNENHGSGFHNNLFPLRADNPLPLRNIKDLLSGVSVEYVLGPGARVVGIELVSQWGMMILPR